MFYWLFQHSRLSRAGNVVDDDGKAERSVAAELGLEASFEEADGGVGDLTTSSATSESELGSSRSRRLPVSGQTCSRTSLMSGDEAEKIDLGDDSGVERLFIEIAEAVFREPAIS